MSAHSAWRSILFAVAAAIPTLSATAFGQNILPPQILDPSVRTAQPPPTARAADILSPPQPGPCPLADSNAEVTLTAVEFRGETALPGETLTPSYSEFLGRPIPVSTICQIRDRASLILFQRGLLARVEVPEQTISEGLLTLDVIEAYVALIQVHGDAGPAQEKVEDYIEELRGLRPFDINKAQRYLLLASDIPGVVIRATLRPSAQGRGAVEMEIEVNRDAIGGVLNANNYGAQATGRVGILGRADFNSFTRFGERTSLIGYSTFDGSWDEQQVLQALEEFRIGSNGLMGRLSLAYGTTRPGDVLRALDVTGKSYVADFRLSYPLVRARSFNAGLSAGFDLIRQDVDIGSSRLTRDKLGVLFGRAAADRALGGYIPVTLGGGLELRHGFGDACSPGGTCFLSRLEGRPGATVVRADGRIALQLASFLQGIGTFQAQYADNPLLAYEEFAIGGLTIGRGYDPTAVSGDHGLGGSAELRVGPFWHGLTLFAFYDVAKVWNRDNGGIDRYLRSAGGGFSIPVAQRARIDVSYASPRDKVSDLLNNTPPSRFLFNLTIGL